MRTDLRRERHVAIGAVRAASRLCRSVRSEFAPQQTATKADRSPVTVADLGSQALISLILAESFPDDPIVGEEDAALLRADADAVIPAAVVRAVASQRPGVHLTQLADAIDRCAHPGGRSGRFWTLDPVDGTKGFMRGGQYAVALALIEDGEVILGVLGCPNMDGGAVFGAAKSAGAWVEPLDDIAAPARIAVSPPADARDAIWAESVEAAHSDQAASAAIGRVLGLRSVPVRMDSQAKYAAVAQGDAAVYLRLPTNSDYRERIWDHAAGWLLVREAGGEVTDVDGRQFDMGTGRRLEHNAGVVATSGGKLHRSVLDAVRTVRQG